MSIVWQRIKPRPAEFHGRIACAKDDPGHQNYMNTITKNMTVMFNGVKQDCCEMADPIEGVLLRVHFDKHGKSTRETVKGHVQILIEP